MAGTTAVAIRNIEVSTASPLLPATFAYVRLPPSLVSLGVRAANDAS